MFRTKRDVQRHVDDVLSKIHNENEKNLRGYTFARLFFQVKDYESAQKFLSGFLSVRDHHAPAHKLMAQIYEVTNSPENALQSYKRSLEIDSHQSDIVLKICELYCQLPVDHETAKYWADRAEQMYPHNEIVFKLRECLVSAEGDPDHQELENLIATELQAQPQNIDLRIKLLRLYLDTERVKQAYEHATLIESKRLFPFSDDWYYLLTDIYEAYQEESRDSLNSQFYIHYLTALDNLIFLNLSEPHAHEKKRKSYSLNDVTDLTLLFDKYLKKASEQSFTEGSWTYFMHHMKGQLFFYMASVLLKMAKKDQGNRKEALKFSAGLALVCYAIKPMNLLQEMWFSQMHENQKLYTHFFQQASLRTSFIGHAIQSMCKEDRNKWLQKIKSDVCIPQVKERIFTRLFSSKKDISSSYFIGDSTFENISLEFSSSSSLMEYDKFAYMLCTSSLHHLVWLEFHQKDNQQRECHLVGMFKGLQYSNKNLSNGSCESLCVLDLESYLYASVYQAEAEIEKKKALNKNWNQNIFISCPPDIADAMCTRQQAEWWRTAHGLFTNTIKEKLGESRRVLQHGLEVIRGIGNHGMEIDLVVHLARHFAEKTENMSETSENSNENKKKVLPEKVTALQSRARHYWNVALGMLEKLLSGSSIKVPKEPVFVCSNRILSKKELKSLQEDGQLYLAVHLMETDKLNEAAEILSKLSTPYGSFYLALTLRRFASFEEKDSNARKMFLTKAQSSIHETMDRIKDDAGHPLNKEIHVVLEDIENELNIFSSISNGNSEDVDEVDSYDGSLLSNQSIYTTPNSSKSNLHSTPKPSAKFLSTVSNSQHSKQGYSKHLEPSPERLDAQIRALTLNQDSVIKAIMDQNKSLLETNKSIVETLKKNNEVLSDLKKQLEELKISEPKTQPKGASKKSYMRNHGDEDYENYQNALFEYCEESNDDYRTPDYSYNQSSRMVQEAAASLNYALPPALPSGPPPHLAHYNYQYPHAMLPAAPVPERPQYYPAPGQSLPFSEGQQLPQFHFHVPSPVVKPSGPMLNNVPSIQHAVTLPPPPLPPLGLQQPPPPVMQPPPSSSTLSMASPWSKPIGVPHAFQIPLSTSASFVSASSQISVTSSSSVTTSPTLKNLLMTPTSVASQSIFSVPSSAQTVSIFSNIAKTPEHLERSRCDSENTGSPEADSHDIEREVMGDFKPLIPLPAEVVVETGEENEEVLFEDRAKLYRFVDVEWKERGVGIVKLLHHKESKRVRLLMRRDQVLKVCANHYITSAMEIKPLKTSDRAWTWVAQDFADEELKPEQFCIKFKTPEVALLFKTAFEKAVNIVKNESIQASKSPTKSPGISSSSPQKPFGSKFLHKSGSWSCPTCYISNSVDKQFCEACETKKPSYASTTASLPEVTTDSVAVSSTSPAASFSFKTLTSNQPVFGTPASNKSLTVTNAKTDISPKSVFGGFTFSSSPTIQEITDPNASEREILVVSTKSKNGPQVTKVNTSKSSPFSGFSFTPTQTSVTKSSLPLGDSNTTSSNTEIKADSNSLKGFGLVSSASSLTITPSANKESVLNKPEVKPSQFTNFSFKASFSSSPLSTNDSAPNSGSNLSKLQSMVQNVSFTSVFNSKDTSVSASEYPPNSGSAVAFSPIVTTENRTTEVAPEDFVPTAEFKPVVPLPALVDLKTGEEDEEQIFAERAKLFRFDSETKEWKERGTGELKILYLRDSQKYRILMRRDQVLKICANHNILSEMKLTPLSTSDRAWVWCAQDFSDGDLVQEKFAAKFKTVEIAKRFFDTFVKCQSPPEKEQQQIDPCQGNKETFDRLFKNASESWSDTNQSGVNFETEKDISQKPLSQLFKPAKDSWECPECYVRNQAIDSKCASCGHSKLNLAVTNTTQVTSLTTSNTQPLSDLFKLPPGSWVCTACLVRNTPDKNKCVSCETAKPGSEASSANKTPSILSKFQFNPVPSSTPSTFPFGSSLPPSDNGFVFGTKPSIQPSTFSFGQSVLTKSDQVAGFKPPISTPGATAVFGGVSDVTSKDRTSISIPPVTAAPTFVFGSSETSFNFGSFTTPKKSDSESVGFRFGSPQKYEFNFGGVVSHSPTKTPKSPKSPATPSDADEDDEVNNSDADIYFTPVIPLPPKVDVKTGEEDERVLFCERAKLYRYSDGEWKERGLGDIKILVDDKSKRTRFLMRREQVLKVCLNHYLTKEIKFDWRGDKSLTWAATDFSENEATPELFAIRFKTAELAQNFKKTVDSVLDDGKKPSSASEKLKNFSFKLETSPKVESNFTSGSLSSCFGNSQLENSVFGAATENKETKASGFSFSFKDKAVPNFFGQTSFGSSNTSAPAFGTGSFKFGFGANTEEKKEEDSDDIEIIYEALPTPEQIAAAEKLMLPKTFYLYEKKDPCPGCNGCSDTILQHKGATTEPEKVKQETVPSVSLSDMLSGDLSAKSTEPEKLNQETVPTANLSDMPFGNLSTKSSFGDLAAKSSFGDFSGKSSFPSFGQSAGGKNVFAGAGTPLFANLNTHGETADDTVPENPDIHFEPIIPLPDLVETKTGEEDEEVEFVFRAKLFRFDAATKQWKERGIGDIKILRHKEKTRFRVILRRDQVHTIACNHVITGEMSLAPLSTSENAVCWNAFDYSDDPPAGHKFAVRFKSQETLKTFKEVFNKCIETMKHQPKAELSKTPTDVSKSEVQVKPESDTPKPTDDVPAPEMAAAGLNNHFTENEGADDENSDELSDEGDELLFEKRVSFEIFNDEEKKFKSAGTSNLKMKYDGSVYGYRITVISDALKKPICDHIIAIQNCLRVEGKKGTWTAIDFSTEPPKRRQFRAIFSSAESVKEFNKYFEEGKENAVNCEIVEQETFTG